MGKRSGKNFLIWYTLLFLFAAVCVAALFIACGKTFVWLDDGISQTMVELESSKRFFLDLLPAAGAAPSFALIENNAALRFFYWGIRNLFAFGFNADGNLVIFTILYAVQAYLSGLFFGAYCLHRGLSWKSALLGSLAYVLSGYSIYVMRQPVFGFTTVLLPLAFWGVDHVLEKRSGWLLTVAIAGVGLCNATMIFPFTMNLAVYILARLFERKEERQPLRLFAKNAAREILCLIKWWLCGAMTAGVMIVPVLSAIQGSSRMDTVISTNSLFYYGLDKSLDFFVRGLFEPQTSSFVGLPVLTLFALLLLLQRRRESRAKSTALTMALLSVVLYLVPLWGLAVRAFADINNNVWYYALVFHMAFALAHAAPLLADLRAEKLPGIFLLGSSFAAFAWIYAAHNEFGNWTAYFTLFWLLLLAILCFIKKRGSKEFLLTGGLYLNMLLLFLTAVNLNLPKYLESSLTLTDYYGQFPDSATLSIEDEEPLWRVEKQEYSGEYNLNLPQWYGYNGTSVFHSLLRSEVTAHLMETENNGLIMNNKVAGFDGRSMIGLLANVKYQLVPTGGDDRIPYGYQLYKENAGYTAGTDIYVNSFDMPLGFTYRDAAFISESDASELTGAALQEVMLQMPVVSSEAEGCDASDAISSAYELAYSVAETDRLELTGRKITAKSNATMVLEIQHPGNSEIYVRMENLMPDKKTVRYVFSCGTVEKEIVQYPHNNYHKVNRDACIANMGYRSEEGTCRIMLTFRQKGEYDLDNIQILAQPMENVPAYVEELASESMQVISMESDRIEGEVSVSNDKWLCFSLPYGAGWELYVDGVKTEAERLNYMYMGVLLSAGTHQITLRYHIPGLASGAVFSLAGIALCAAFCLLERKKQVSL